MSSLLPLHLPGGHALPRDDAPSARAVPQDRAPEPAHEPSAPARTAAGAPDGASAGPAFPRLTSTGAPPTTDELGRHVGSSLPPESRHTFVLDWFIDTIRLEDGTLVYRVVGADFVNTDVCFFCRSEQEARTLLALVDGVCTTHTVIKTQLRR